MLNVAVTRAPPVEPFPNSSAPPCKPHKMLDTFKPSPKCSADLFSLKNGSHPRRRASGVKPGPSSGNAQGQPALSNRNLNLDDALRVAARIAQEVVENLFDQG